VAQAILTTSRAEDGLFTPEDLAGHRSTWVEPISTTYRGVAVAELPPNGQGLTALVALNLLECFDPSQAPATSGLDWHRRIEAIKLACADRDAYLADPQQVAVPVNELLDKRYARRRAASIGERALPGASAGLGSGDTVYLCAADERGNLVSLIQSLFSGFGSGIGCGDTGVVLQSRAAGFRLESGHPNALAPGKRPSHTLMPGMLLRDGVPWLAFGVMGGDVQPQGHVAFVANLVDHGLNPQEALDRARFRYLGGAQVALETPDLPLDAGRTLAEALRARGHAIDAPGEVMADRFGAGQALAMEPGGLLVGASDRRKDGAALGLWE
jgi:gamma-glutamyltranspeptidase/glutathione hydrolase